MRPTESKSGVRLRRIGPVDRCRSRTCAPCSVMRHDREERVSGAGCVHPRQTRSRRSACARRKGEMVGWSSCCLIPGGGGGHAHIQVEARCGISADGDLRRGPNRPRGTRQAARRAQRRGEPISGDADAEGAELRIDCTRRLLRVDADDGHQRERHAARRHVPRSNARWHLSGDSRARQRQAGCRRVLRDCANDCDGGGPHRSDWLSWRDGPAGASWTGGASRTSRTSRANGASGTSRGCRSKG